MNLACGYDSNVQPNFEMNESCPLLVDEPDRLVMEPESPWTEFKSLGQMFDVPGMDENVSTYIPPQPMTATCSVSTSIPSDYSFIIRDAENNVVDRYDGNTKAEDDDCRLESENLEKGNLYQLIIISEEEVTEATYRVEMDYYDGVPENMNNKSQWIGPEVEMGGMSLRPTIFLNFFGLGFFLMFWPASYYWDRVKDKTNKMEEKFPDFLRDLAEYWKEVCR